MKNLYFFNEASKYIGGIAGYNIGKLINCRVERFIYEGIVNEDINIGMICGFLRGYIDNCYYLKSGNLNGTGNKSDGETGNDVKPFGAELKIPVRVKINYDPSNNLESLVSKNFKHEFFRKKTYDDSWEEMLQNIHYFYTVSPVENSIKINPDGSKTQDFIFSYYIYHAKDSSGKDYKFGFNKKYPVNTYLKQDVGGGKKLFIDYGVWGRK